MICVVWGIQIHNSARAIVERLIPVLCTATANCVCIQTVYMSTSIRVSDGTKQLLESLKREEETFDDLLERLAQHERPIAIGAWSEDDATRARAVVKRSRESFER